MHFALEPPLETSVSIFRRGYNMIRSSYHEKSLQKQYCRSDYLVLTTVILVLLYRKSGGTKGHFLRVT